MTSPCLFDRCKQRLQSERLPKRTLDHPFIDEVVPLTLSRARHEEPSDVRVASRKESERASGRLATEVKVRQHDARNLLGDLFSSFVSVTGDSNAMPPQLEDVSQGLRQLRIVIDEQHF
jgi:hypothetical protein